jgi:predicted metal-dependent phosphoesterase TrpH
MLDLHLHSTMSDGLADLPTVRAAVATRPDLRLVALADHDKIEGSVALAADEPRAVVAAELNAKGGASTLHLLGLGLDPTDERLITHLAARTSERVVRFLGYATILGELGYTFDADPYVADTATHQPTKADVVRELLRHEANRARLVAVHGCDLDDPQTVYALFERGGVADIAGRVADTLPGPAAAIAIIHDAGGLAVVAHPIYVPLQDGWLKGKRRLERWAAAGLDGIEVFHPDQLGHERFGDILALTRSLGLLVGVGSDDHSADLGALGTALPSNDPRAEAITEAWEVALGRR